MTTYTSKNGKLGITNEVSGGYSHEMTIPTNARIRNAELPLVLEDCLKMTEEIAELKKEKQMFLGILQGLQYPAVMLAHDLKKLREQS